MYVILRKDSNRHTKCATFHFKWVYQHSGYFEVLRWHFRHPVDTCKDQIRQAATASLTKKSHAVGENGSRTGFTSTFRCSISTFKLTELTRSGVSCWGKKKQDIVISTQTHIKSLLWKRCLPERRPESLDRIPRMIFLPLLSESGRCFWWTGLLRWLVSPVSRHPKSKCRTYLKEEKRALCIRLLNTWLFFPVQN